MIALDTLERAALLRCRSAGRYDGLGKKSRKPTPPNEAAEEQAVWNVDIPARVWLDLDRRGLISRKDNLYRLTDAGRAALAIKGAA